MLKIVVRLFTHETDATRFVDVTIFGQKVAARVAKLVTEPGGLRNEIISVDQVGF